MDLLYGRNSVTEALRAGHRPIRRLLIADGSHPPDELIADARRQRVAIESADRRRLDQLVSHAHHQGVVAEAEPFKYSHLDDLLGGSNAQLLLALDSLQDPQNFGTLLRTAQACGVDGVIIPEHRAVGVSPAVSNASAGAVEHLRVTRATNLTRALQQLKSRGIWVYGLAVDAETPFHSVDWTGPAALVVGSEGAGLGRLVRETCDVLVQIPMSKTAIQSLNASVAGSIVLYEAFRQRAEAQSR
jgi:23S rRNA (guanosine2251-2'-O)-methyltransferase